MLPDGTYDAIVIDVEDGGDGAFRLELTILGGVHKGEVVAVRASGIDGDPVDLLGVPATVTVIDSSPHVTLEP